MTKEDFIEKARRAINGWVSLYGVPVYLVGGALRDEKPRDYDIRMTLNTNAMLMLFGRPHDWERPGIYDPNTREWAEWEWRRAYEEQKRSRGLSCITSVRCDVQFQSELEASPYGSRFEKVRIDTAPDHMLHMWPG